MPPYKYVTRPLKKTDGATPHRGPDLEGRTQSPERWARIGSAPSSVLGSGTRGHQTLESSAELISLRLWAMSKRSEIGSKSQIPNKVIKSQSFARAPEST